MSWQTVVSLFTAIVTWLMSLITSIPVFVKTVKSKPDMHWLITAGETVEHTYDEYYEFYQSHYKPIRHAYNKDGTLKTGLKDVTAQWQALLDENLKIAQKWRETPGVGQVNFYNSVKDGGPWDYKLLENHEQIAKEWGLEPGENQFMVYGVCMEWEALGNVNFAFTGGATGFTPTTIFTGGGIVEYIHTDISWERLGTYFDEQEDNELITFGLALYSFVDPSYEQQAKTIDALLDIADPRVIVLADVIYKEIEAARG